MVPRGARSYYAGQPCGVCTISEVSAPKAFVLATCKGTRNGTWKVRWFGERRTDASSGKYSKETEIGTTRDSPAAAIC